MKKKAIDGKKVMLFLEGSSVGDGTVCLSTGFTLTYNVNMVDPETKDDGNYQHPDEEGDRWDISHNSQSDVDFDTAQKLVDDWNDTKEIDIKIAQVSNWSDEGLDGATGGAWTPDKTGTTITGKTVISSVNVDAGVTDKAAISVNFNGRSALEVNTAE